MEVGSGFEEIYKENFDKVYRTAYLICRDRQTAEDSAQEAFARALRRWDRLSNEPYVLGWIMRTALNLATRSFRLRRVLLMGLMKDEPNAVSDFDNVRELDLWAAISRLPAQQRRALVLRYFADMDIREIARTLGCQPGTVKAHLYRARGALKDSSGVEA